jgi:SAM-dependent methyltransferase
MDEIKQTVRQYYTDKIKQHGSSHWGVDWNSTESQYQRFEQLSKLIQHQPCSILDYGCGYGALVDFLDAKSIDYTYVGLDISTEMIDVARSRYADKQNVQFVSDAAGIGKVDYVVASGLFNVRLEATAKAWKNYMQATIDEMWQFCTKGIAFNALTTYSDADYMRDYLYYSDPLFWFDHFKREKTKQVALLHDYELYEFTLIARHEGKFGL